MADKTCEQLLAIVENAKSSPQKREDAMQQMAIQGCNLNGIKSVSDPK